MSIPTANDTELCPNQSTPLSEQTFASSPVWTVIIVFTVALLTVSANILVLFVAPKVQHLPEYSKFFMMSIASADLGIGLVCSLAIVPSVTGSWPYGRTLCELQAAMSVAFSAISVLGILLLHIERCVAIQKPLHYHSILSKRKCFGAIAASWVLYTTYGITVVILGREHLRFDYMTYQCSPAVMFSKQSMLPFLIILCFICLFPSSVGIMIINYKITRTVKRLQRRVCPQTVASFVVTPAGKEPTSRSERAVDISDDTKTYRTFFIVAVGFHVSWLPLPIMDIYCFSTGTELNPTAQFLLFWLAMSNSFWNFFIYSGRSKGFRNTVWKMFKSFAISYFCRLG